ncbi:MAG: phosphate/phosphite/phosphonate ABC transporter substrate-binding protein [Candidatus Methanomethyliaceae archaeon]
MVRNRMSCSLWIVFGLVCICICFTISKDLCADARELAFGVTYVDDPVPTFKRWEPLGEYLSKVLNASVKVVPVDLTSSVQWLEAAKVQIMLTNPLIFYIAKDKAQLLPIAIIVQKSKTDSDRYGSVIFVRANSPVKTIHDLGGKSVGIASRSSLGGGIGGLALLEQEGVKVDQLALKELKVQDNVVFAVVNGTVDVGIVRTGILEKLASEKKINMNDLRVLHKIDDNFPFVHSTPLWPEWILVIRSADISPQEREQMKRSLVGLSANSELLTKLGLAAFKDPTEILSSNAQFFDMVLKTYQKLSK